MQNSCPYSSILPLLSLGDFGSVSKLIWSAKSLLASSFFNLLCFYMMTYLRFIINDFLEINVIMSLEVSESLSPVEF